MGRVGFQSRPTPCAHPPALSWFLPCDGARLSSAVLRHPWASKTSASSGGTSSTPSRTANSLPPTDTRVGRSTARSRRARESFCASRLKRRSSRKCSRSSLSFIRRTLPRLSHYGHARGWVDVVDNREGRAEVAGEDLVDVDAVLVAARPPGPLDLVVVHPDVGLQDVGHARELVGHPIGPEDDRSGWHVGMDLDFERVPHHLVAVGVDRLACEVETGGLVDGGEE